MKSIYYYIFRYIYKNATPEQKDFYNLILENERIKRKIGSSRCR